MKQTAVEFLEEIYLTTGIDRNFHFAKAKEIEKEQTIAFADKYDAYVVQGGTLTAEQYYNETYGGAE
jgi:hypothetical protein